MSFFSFTFIVRERASSCTPYLYCEAKGWGWIKDQLVDKPLSLTFWNTICCTGLLKVQISALLHKHVSFLDCHLAFRYQCYLSRAISFYPCLQNYQLKLKQEVHYKELVESAKKYKDELDKAEVVERDRVDEALTEKLDLARKFAQELKGWAFIIILPKAWLLSCWRVLP